MTQVDKLPMKRRDFMHASAGVAATKAVPASAAEPAGARRALRAVRSPSYHHRTSAPAATR